jgi:hypothetical protein
MRLCSLTFALTQPNHGMFLEYARIIFEYSHMSPGSNQEAHNSARKVGSRSPSYHRDSPQARWHILFPLIQARQAEDQTLFIRVQD